MLWRAVLRRIASRVLWLCFVLSRARSFDGNFADHPFRHGRCAEICILTAYLKRVRKPRASSEGVRDEGAVLCHDIMDVFAVVHPLHTRSGRDREVAWDEVVVTNVHRRLSSA